MILHVDMDAFFASVEQLDNPKLLGQCVIVGGMTNRGVVSAASYEARKFGVHSAMPVYKAKQLCPKGIFLPPRIKRYKEVSHRVMDILKGVSPLVEPVSIDEAYIDISGCERLHGDPLEIAIQLKKDIKNTVHLTCSIGVAPNKFMAKIASDMNKPNGLKVIMPEAAPQFIESIPIDRVPGVGKKIKKKLDHLGIITLKNIEDYPGDILINRLGKFGKRLIELSACIDSSYVNPESKRKSVSCEETLQQDTEDKDVLGNYILKFSEAVGKELRRMGVQAKTIQLKVKHVDFKQISRRVTLRRPTQSSETIYAEALTLFNNYTFEKKVRLIGVGASGFVSMEKQTQLDMFAELTKRDNTNWESVDRVVDKIEKKYGENMIRRASLRK